MLTKTPINVAQRHRHGRRTQPIKCHRLELGGEYSNLLSLKVGELADRAAKHQFSSDGFFVLANSGRLLRCVIGRFAVCSPRLRKIWTVVVKASQFRRALEDLELTQKAAAELLGVSLRTVEGYVAGSRRIPGPVGIVINLLVGGVLTKEQVDAVR
jgi:hypothetical protein